MESFSREYYRDFGDFAVDRIRYQSNGHWVNGFLVLPKERDGALPCVIFNRGGSFEFGAIDDDGLERKLAGIASWGYAVIASQYSGNGGSEGKDEIGGADVDDVLVLKEYLPQIPEVDSVRIGMWGGSRGGMMTYQCLARVDWIKAAVSIAGMANYDRAVQNRPEMADVYHRGFGNTPDGRRIRSAANFTDRFCKTTPVLLMHGTGDWRVSPKDSLELAEKLYDAKVPYRLVIFEGADHGLTEHRAEAWDIGREWLDRYVKNSTALPNLEPHGK